MASMSKLWLGRMLAQEAQIIQSMADHHGLDCTAVAEAIESAAREKHRSMV